VPGHYFDPDPHVGSSPRRIGLALPDVTFELVSDAGVFAGDAVDRGTKVLLLDGPAPPPRGDLLDLGCGYGPIALTLAHRAPGATVWAVDVNRRALDLCRSNAERASLLNVRVCAPDEVEGDVTFAAIYSNPPVRIGKPALHDLLSTWLARLTDDGRAELVVQRNLGADSLARWLAEEGWHVERLQSRQGYRLLEVTR